MPKGVYDGPRGRPKGRISNANQQIIDICNDYGLNPFEAMCAIACDQKNELSYRLHALKELCQYVYPKLKSVEFTGHVTAEVQKAAEKLEAVKIMSKEQKRKVLEDALKALENE